VTKDIDALKQVNRSGFPFQLKVEGDIRAMEQSHHWSIASRELNNAILSIESQQHYGNATS
jgi:hypothetical protein